MTTAEIVAEMLRKPDAHLLIEWIDEYILPIGDPVMSLIDDAITAYFTGIES